ncbi:MAG: enoyl-ACP reductase [Acidobacteriota bacterium]|nr:enoyl-ACP reductase [Acidobacteriota bacterium]
MILKDKNILVLGIANHRSIAYAIAKFCNEQGANICLTFQNERLRRNAEKLAKDFGEGTLLLPCDVTVEEEVAGLFAEIGKRWERLDGLVHSIAFANQEDLKGDYVDTSRDGWLMAQEISAFSLTQLARHAKDLMKDGGSIICMSYLGGERVVQNYNVMGVAKASLEMSARYLAHNLGPHGIRVNIVSPGPIKTLAASAVAGLKSILDDVRERNPLRRNVSQEDVAKVSAFLLSDLSTAVTGETIHVDAGYHTIGM